MASENSRLTYDHIVRVLLDAADGTPIALLLRGEGITNLRSLRQYLRKPGLDKATYEDSKGDKHELTPEEYQDLSGLQSYLNWLQNNYGPQSDAYFDVTTRTRNDYELFWDRVFEGKFIPYDEQAAVRSKRSRGTPQSHVPPPAPDATGQTTAPVPTPKSAVSTWMKGVKRDASAFQDLSKDYQYDQWRRSTLATAHAQQVHLVFNDTYIPAPGSEEEEVFRLMNDFVYSVFANTLKTLKGAEIVKSHEADRDAQTVYAKLAKHYTESTAATGRATELFKKITANTIPESRRDTLQSYIARWSDWVREYNLLTSTTMDSRTMMVHFERYVESVPELDIIKTNIEMFATTHRVVPTSEQIALYESRATQIDNKASRNFRTRRSQQANMTEMEYDDDDVPDGWGEEFELYEAHYTGSNGTPRRRFGPSLNKDAWTSLSPDAKIIWDKLDRDQKEIILNSRKPNTSSITAASPAPQASSATRQVVPNQERNVNFTEVSDDPPSTNASTTNEADDGTPDVQTLSINHTESIIDAIKLPKISVNESQVLPPNDIRRVLSQPPRPSTTLPRSTTLEETKPPKPTKDGEPKTNLVKRLLGRINPKNKSESKDDHRQVNVAITNEKFGGNEHNRDRQVNVTITNE